MKKINENQLRRVVRESINKILKEDYVWWGDTKPLETIMVAASEIRRYFEEQYPDDNYEFDEDDRAKLDLYNWAKRVENDAEDFIRYNAHNTPINGGEDW
jgi:hypothetical protein